MLELCTARAIGSGKVRHELRQQWGCDGRDDGRKALTPARGLDFEEISAAIGRRRNASHRFGGVYRSAARENAVGETACHDAEPTLDVAEALAVAAAGPRRTAEAHLRPHPGHRDRFGVAAELRAQQRSPDQIVDLAAR